ncbi:AraC family transcriptional regulator [Paenibacillus sp. S150]|uniref:helix-turn-helix transcriptional regulator n=1 Tax=Paenibacillus sp. S150 TaxID=2749826 RepID=UPI001C619F1F|nr:AraC family transcriptional regulator [Paenibacillus sp. S150]MBW4082718.1 AraC family transcriptional regulator [Paenibacillus sp. S150]
MKISEWKTVLPPVFNALCREIRIQDAVVDWVDIIFEQIGTASKCPSHAHTWFEFNYVLAGQLETQFGADSISVQEGEFFLIPPGMVHSHSYTRGNPHEGLCFRWRIARAEPENDGEKAFGLTGGGEAEGSFYARLQRLHHWRPGSYRDEEGFGRLLKQFLEEAAVSRSELGLQLLLVRLLDQLSRLQQEMEGDAKAVRTPQDPIVRKVDIYLEDFQGSRLSVAGLAASLHMSYGHLSREYKRLTGYTIVERMNQIRLEKARELLLLPGILISEAAEQAGFADLSYFSRTFKKHYGQGPQSYRREYAASIIPAAPDADSLV